MEPEWLLRARKLQAIAQTGLTFATDPYDIERYETVRDLAIGMIAEGSGLPHGRLETLYLEERGYATPKVDVRGAVFKDDRILLVRESSDGCWTLPGGWADVNETPSIAIEKEIREESGFTARAKKLCAVLDRTKHGHMPALPYHVYKLFFLCDLTGGEASTSIETTEVAFFSPDALPELSLGRIKPEQIAMMVRHHQDPDLAPEFD